ncbi:hypothetical protein [Roseivirga echinicomitans]|uniref:Uncharacterized protein n=1 Tax=Roseivirga echinicomitans TaxID=296218 RepID=A0A150XXU0_9BACT|nr:hypothetical protein [Roseivirga echinicomitans]KYG83599.1 hypothetical protein AWN68_02000 [Roseivirga echinicomitans]
MDIQTEKLHLIEQLTRLQDVSIIKRVKELLQSVPKEKIIGSTPDGSTITESDLIARAQASERAIEQGDVISIESLEEETKTW